MAVQAVSLDHIKGLIQQGLENFDNSKLKEAELLLTQILNIDPDNWAVIFYLAGLLMQTGRTGESIALFHRCHQLLPDERPEIWNNIGTAYRRENHDEKALEALKRALALNPDDADILNNIGTLFVNEGRPEEGEPYLRRAVELNPNHKHAHWNLGLVLLEQEKWAEGFEEYTWGLSTRDRMVKEYGIAQWWDGEPAPGKKLVIYGEQGIGDEIMFASMIPDAVERFGGEVILDVHPRLFGMMRRSFPDLKVFPTRKVWDREVDWLKEESPIHYKCPMGNLGRWFRRTEADFPKKPYIVPDRERVEEYKEWLRALGPGPYVGVSWVGGHRKTRKDVRAIALAAWMPLFRALPDATFISCQYTDHGIDDTQALEKEHGVKIWHFPEVFESSRFEKWHVGDRTFRNKDEAKHYAAMTNQDLVHEYPTAYDYDETAAFVYAIHELGGTIASVNTSLVHLCGAMGVACFTLTPTKCAWRYNLKRKDMVWYPKDSVRQYRQQGEDWGPAFAQLVTELEEYLEGNDQRAVPGAEQATA